MARGIYGQCEGDEARSNSQKWEDHLHANEICEGALEAKMVEFAKRGYMTGMARLREEIKTSFIQGGVIPWLAQERADSILRRASIHLRIR